MATLNQNHSMFAGETKTFSVTCTSVSTGALVDFTAATITWSLFPNGSTTATLTKTVGAGITVTGTGTFTITLSASNTSSLLGTYIHQCRATLSDGTVTTLFSGTINVSATLI